MKRGFQKPLAFCYIFRRFWKRFQIFSEPCFILPTIPRGHEVHGADVLEGRRPAVVGREDAHREPEVPEVASDIRPGTTGQDRTGHDRTPERKAPQRKRKSNGEDSGY